MKAFAHFSNNYRHGFATDGLELYKVQEGKIIIVETPEKNQRYEINRLISKNGNNIHEFNKLEDALNYLVESYHNCQVDDLVRASNHTDLKNEIEKNYNDLLKNQPIQTTVENIRIVLRYLNTINWGQWELPKMTIAYSANQYDCDGKPASTIILSEPISDIDFEVENEFKFKIGGSVLHLKEYRSL